MELLCIGLNHKTAPVEVRERFAVNANKLGEAAAEARGHSGAAEAVVISTCNRTEFYLATPEPSATAKNLFSKLEPAIDDPSHPPHHWYQKSSEEAAVHLCRVACGLDSMMLGETEIFGQIKQAYKAAHEAGTTGSLLNRLFQRSFGIGKKVRTDTRIQEGATSVANVAVELAEKIFGKLKDSRVIVLGAGETSRQTAQALVSRGASTVFVANRSFDRAQELADQIGGRAVKFDEWQSVLAGVDVVISATASPHSVVMPFHVEAVRRIRKFRPLFFIDIAVPRDIDPAVGEIEEVYLYDIDTLEQLADEARSRRIKQIEECDQIILNELRKSGLLDEP